MSNIDKIRQEINRRHDYENEMYHKKKSDGRPNDGWAESLAIMGVLEELLSFIDSLPDEPVSNDLEEAAKTFCDTLEGKEAWSYGPSHYDWDDVNNAFIAGAEWMAKQKEQKSAKCIEDSIEFKEGFKTGRETGLRDGQKYVLDNLASYGLCKLAEWSKEDEDKVVQYLHDRDGGMLWSKATDITRDILDMLRPSWKPSENQMSMLLAVVNDPNNAGSASCHLSLKSLYNDLKKL